MNQKYSTLLHNLNEQLNFIDLEIDDQIKKCEQAIPIILKSINELKNTVLKTNFNSENEEIQFFKEIKPQFTSELFFYNTVYNIEIKRPKQDNEILKKYYNNELQIVKKIINNELEFYQYYQYGKNYLDNKYFLRGKSDIKLGLDPYYFENDTTFATSHDFKAATILANELIELYIEDQLNKLENKKKS